MCFQLLKAGTDSLRDVMKLQHRIVACVVGVLLFRAGLFFFLPSDNSYLAVMAVVTEV